MADVLPGFEWSKSSSRYRDFSTGRFVARTDIMGLLDNQVQGLERRLGGLTQALQEGRLAPAYFAEQVRTELRRAHLQQRALGAGGWHELTAADYGSVGRHLRDDYARIANLAQGIKDGSVSMPQALGRIDGYAGSARVEYFEAERQRQRSEGGDTLLMIRDLGVAEHCQSCINYYAEGWALDLPIPGVASECGPRCKCGIRYRLVSAGQVAELLGTRRG